MTMNRQSIATLSGFLVAPLIPVVVMAVLSLPNKGPWVVFFEVMAIVYVGVAILMTIIGLPTFLLFKSRNLTRWWSFLLVGLFAGALVGYAYRLPFYPDRYQSGLVQGLACGLAGVVFWLIWRSGREDRP